MHTCPCSSVTLPLQHFYFKKCSFYSAKTIQNKFLKHIKSQFFLFQSVAACCGVLRHTAACCSLLRCAAVRCSVMQIVAYGKMCCSALKISLGESPTDEHAVAVCCNTRSCSVLQHMSTQLQHTATACSCVAAHCNCVQYAAAGCSVLQVISVYYSVFWYIAVLQVVYRRLMRR